MRNDLISKSALKKTFEDAELGEHSLIESVLAAGVYAVIDNAPTIDAVPVVHARWKADKYFDEPVMRCTACKCGFAAGHKAERFKYCPNCGAKMDGGAE